MRVHAIVEDIHGARCVILAGATVVQLRAKVPTDELVARGLGFRSLRERSLSTTTLRPRSSPTLTASTSANPTLARTSPDSEADPDGSATTFEEATSTDADYLGVGPIWTTPSKVDAATPLGLRELARICASVAVPVIAIGGIDAYNAASCIRAGAAGVAAIRAATDPTLRMSVDDALRAQSSLSRNQITDMKKSSHKDLQISTCSMTPASQACATEALELEITAAPSRFPLVIQNAAKQVRRVNVR